MNERVICKDWAGTALEREVVGQGARVFYVSFPSEDSRFSAAIEPPGFPKEDVYQFKNGIAGRQLTTEDWATLERYEGSEGPIRCTAS